MIEEDEGEEDVIDGPADETVAEEAVLWKVKGVAAMTAEPFHGEEGQAPEYGCLAHREGLEVGPLLLASANGISAAVAPALRWLGLPGANEKYKGIKRIDAPSLGYLGKFNA